MLQIIKQYFCDYCGLEVDQDQGVLTLQCGKIGYEGEVISENFPEKVPVRHYHRGCLHRLLSMNGTCQPDVQEEEKAPEPEPEQKSKNKDLPALQAFIDAGRTQRWCAAEFGVSESTIHYWLKEIMLMKKNKTWESYCEERRDGK